MASPKEFGRILEAGMIEEFGRPLEEEAASEPRGAKEIAKQGAIGGAEGLFGTYGDLLNLVGLSPEEMLPGERARREAEFEASPQSLGLFLEEDELAPSFTRLPRSSDVKDLLELLGVGTEPQSLGGRYARRIGGNLGGGVATGASPGLLAQLGVSGGLGQSVEEVLGPAAGLGAEFLSLLAPQALSNKLAVSRKLKPTVEAAKKAGISEKSLAPLLRGERSTKALGKFAKKGKFSERRLKDIKGEIGKSRQSTKKAGEFFELGGSTRRQLVKGLENFENSLGKTLSGSEKSKVRKVVSDLSSSLFKEETTAKELMDYWGEINDVVDWRKVQGGKKTLSKVKDLLGEALQSTSPELYKTFQLENKLFSKYYDLQKALKPGTTDAIINIGEYAPLVKSVLTASPGGILTGIETVAISEGGRRALTRYMLSPRTQGKLRKVVDLTNAGKVQQAQVIARQIQKGYDKKIEAAKQS